MDSKKHTDKAVEILTAAAKVAGKRLLVEVVLPALHEYAAETPTKLDDMAVNIVSDAANKAVEGL